MNIVFVIIISFFIALVMYIFYARKMTSNINYMINQIQIISEGKHEIKLKSSSIYEVNLLSNAINKLGYDLYEYKFKLEKNYLEGIQTLVKTLEMADAYTKGHSERVAFYTVEIAKSMGIDEEEVERLRLAALMHDIGKIGIPSTLLNKQGKLTDEEYVKIKEHPLIGYEILSISHMFNKYKEIIKYHHERFDGKGYPMKIKGKDIPIGARILTIADAFDAMTSNRAYRSAMPLTKAIEIIKNEQGKQFDPEVVEVFLNIVEDTYNKTYKMYPI